ncbi:MULTISPECIES: hypothetical protein [Halobacteriovorax]|uniref:Uncharacterized protein n=1 Tax=Halobacteriovorax vibrionivorans TaxID=2152716 RepID=A0ABY0IIF0_9BACT|nr:MULTISPECIES: hypothetical protein [Halobacteriovorax]RZF22249.1 hypothetical protein DAY19_00340 [Halobacteriovorax vibrionivorans]TGD48501.1 hypothetical protein EP118_03255 [Halobacteriovorax sp. Y22]
MKALLVVLFSLTCFAQTTVISERTVQLPVDISSAKLKWTNLGYGSIYFVKVIVPQLAGETFLNHRNVGEDGPCLFTHDTRNVEDVVGDNPSIEDVDFKIKLSKQTIKLDEQKCGVVLIEDVRANIRGFEFQHTLRHTMPERHIDDCF